MEELIESNESEQFKSRRFKRIYWVY